MSDEIAGVGIRVDTDGITGGIKALDGLADQGPKVEKSLQGVEASAAKTGKSIASLGQGGAEAGLAKVGKAGRDAAADVGKLGDSASKAATSTRQIDKASNETARAIAGVGSAVKSLVTSNEAVVASIRGVVGAETAYIASLNEEAKQLRAAIAERDKYIAQAQGMLAASKEIAAGIGSQVASLKQVQGASSQASESLLSMVRTGVGAFLGGAVVSSAKAAAGALYEASAASERLRTMLNFASGGNGAQEIEYLRQVTGSLGLEFASTSRAYGQFQAAARGTALEGQKARDVFESIAKASAVMGLSTEQTSGVLLALQQMISKGTVQAEELRGQLGERLPGAFQIAAKAMGVTTAELGKMLEQGQVVADDFLPRFARALNENIGGSAEQAADRLDAAANRFANAWERTKQIIGDAGVSSAIKGEIKGLTDDITVFGETMDAVKQKGGGFLAQIAAASGVEAGRLAFATLNGGANLLNGTINTLTGNVFGLRTDLALLPDVFKTNAQQAAAMAQDLARAEAEYVKLKAQGADTSQNFYLRNEFYNLGQYIAKLKEAQQERDKLAKQPAYSAARDSNDASVAEAKRLDQVRAAMEKVQMSLSGVKDSFYKDLAALKAGYDAGLIKLADYQQQVAKLTEQSGGGKAVSSAAAAAQREREQQLEREASLIEKSIGLSGSYYTSLEDLNKARQRGALVGQAYVDAVNALTNAQPFAVKSAKELAESLKGVADAEAAGIKLREQYIDGLNRGADAAAKQLQGLRDEEQAAAIAAAGNISLAQAIQQVAIARLQEQQAAVGADTEAAAAIEREIAARRELITLIGNGEARKAATDAAREAEREWVRAAERIQDSLTDALMRGFESGKDFGRNLRDSLVNLFKTLVLRPIIQPIAGVLSGGITGLAGGLLGGLGIPGSANAADAGGLAGLGSLGSLAGLAGLSGQAGSIGSAIAAGFMNTVGGGTLAGGQAAGLLAGGAGTGTGFAGMLGAALPWVGGAALIGNALGLFRSTKTVGSGITGNLGGSIEDFEVRRKGGSLFSGPSYSTPTIGVSNLNADLQATFAALRNTAAGFASTLGLDAEAARRFVTPIGSEKLSDDTGGLGIRLEGLSADEVAKKIEAELTAANERLAAAVLGTAAEAFTRAGETASQTLERLAGSLQGVNGVLDALGQAALQASAQGGAYASALLDQFGSLQQFQSAAGQYLQDYYSQAERSALATQGLSQQLGSLGLSVPSTRDAYRQLVEAQDLSTEAGRKAYAALLQLAPTFAELVPAIEAVADVVDDTAQRMAEAGRRALEDLARDSGSLQVDLLRAQGDESAARALERDQALAAVRGKVTEADLAAITAAYDLNQAYRDQIDSARAAVEAQRAIEAAQKSAAESLKRTLDDLAGTRLDLEGQLLTAQGREAEAQALARQRELEKLTGGLGAEDAARVVAAYELNEALRKQIAETNAANQAAQALADAQSRAAEDAARAASQFRDAWKSITDSLFDEVARIRGLFGASGGDSLASLQSRFAITTAQARAGDQEAAKLLPGLSQTLLQLAEEGAASLIDLQRIRAQVAGSLEQTGLGLAGRYGFSVPKLEVGTNYVPKDMLALLHEGEAVVPRAFNPAASGGENGQVVAELRAVQAELREMRARLDAGNRNTARVASAVEGNQSTPILVELAK